MVRRNDLISSTAIRALTIAAATFFWTAASQAASGCTVNLKPAIQAPYKVSIDTAAWVPAVAAAATGSASPVGALPRYCRISGRINERQGADGRTYAIGFQIALPEAWNGRLLFQGGGGLNGTINPPLGSQATGDRPALARGFAVVSTDSGHKSRGGGFDASFRADQQAALDFAQGSVGTTTLVAKQVVAAHYGRAAHHNYIVGCSTGGREAMLASQRYPDLFDGVIAGAPAMRTGYSNIAAAYIAATLNRAAEKDQTGRPKPLFSDLDKALILRAMLEDCDGADGLVDGVIAKAGACAFRPARIVCSGGKLPSCLSSVQVKALETAFMPPRDAAGAVIYPSFPWDTGIVASGGGIPGLLTTGMPSPLGPPSGATEIDLDARLLTVRADAMQALTDTSNWTNLSTFLDRGGKIMWYHGVSDPWFSANDTLDYYRRAAAANGARFLQASRLYMVPGAGHCGGGANTFDGFDLLSALVDWVETGKAPDPVPARRQSPTPAERPLCSFPSYPRYKGAGDEASAANFECRVDQGDSL